MIITLSILVLYTSLTIVTQTVTIQQPTVSVYTELQTKYSQTLVCPCTQIAINYEQFISFDPTFHQICSSDFITAEWLHYLTLKNGVVANALDLRVFGQSFFSTLSAFCVLSLETINNALLVFNSTKYVTKNVQQTDLFQSQTEQIINLFEQTTTNSYLQGLSMGRQMTFGNALFSGLLTSYYFKTIGNNSFDQVFYPAIYYPDDSSSCSCKSYPSICSEPTGIGTLSTSSISRLLFVVPGLWYGCYIIESLFGSTFECYFDQSCLDQISPFNAEAMIYNSSNTQVTLVRELA
jgi:hypothetical protein